MKIVIGNKNYSSWSLRAWLALAATGADFEEIVIPLDTPDTKAEIARHTGSGRVPVLLDDGVTVWDSLAIIEYLAERYPEAGLWSADPTIRAHQRCICAEMHSGFAALRHYYPMNIRRSVDDRPATPEVQADIDRICFLWREALEESSGEGPYLFGGFSAEDAMFAPVVSRFETYNVPVGDLERGYMDAILTNPLFERWAQAAKQETWTIESEEV